MPRNYICIYTIEYVFECAESSMAIFVGCQVPVQTRDWLEVFDCAILFVQQPIFNLRSIFVQFLPTKHISDENVTFCKPSCNTIFHILLKRKLAEEAQAVCLLGGHVII